MAAAVAVAVFASPLCVAMVSGPTEEGGEDPLAAAGTVSPAVRPDDEEAGACECGWLMAGTRQGAGAMRCVGLLLPSDSCGSGLTSRAAQTRGQRTANRERHTEDQPRHEEETREATQRQRQSELQGRERARSR